MRWFDVDKAGLAKLLERRGKEFVLFELIQNAWDQNIMRVDVTLRKEAGSRRAILKVEDDDPQGFSDLTHSFTLFAESDKKSNPRLRGRFNLGEKLVLAMCDEAEILTTTGGVRFDRQGRHSLRRRRERGSVFEASIRMTNEEFLEVCAAVARLIPPPGIKTTFNGELLPAREPLHEFEASLPTEIADATGNLKRTIRKTKVHVFQLREGEVGTIYELGIPVVETGDHYHCDVQQKVPVNLDRDNVPPSYLRSLRTHMLNALHDRLDSEQANASWVRDAIADPNTSASAISSAIKQRFGENALAFDLSDLEANNIAVSKGYTIVSGSQLTKAEWNNVRRAGALPPAGHVTPSAKPFSDDPDAKPLALVPLEKWSKLERAWVACAKRWAIALLGCEIEIDIANDASWLMNGAYGGKHLTVNKGRLGAKFFAEMSVEGLRFLIHEFGHEYEGNHLSAEYHKALCRLGARAAFAAVRDSSLLSAHWTEEEPSAV